MKYNILLSNKAEKDLTNIYYYIAYVIGNLAKAKEFYNKLIYKIYSLKDFPYMYKLRYEKQFIEFDIRSFNESNYLILYKIDENNNIYIFRIVYSKQNFDKIDIL